MDTEKDFEEATGAGLGEGDIAELTEVVDDDLVDDELPVEVDPEEDVDEGAMGSEDDDQKEIEELIFDELYGDQN